jgi:hypothetical protein
MNVISLSVLVTFVYETFFVFVLATSHVNFSILAVVGPNTAVGVAILGGVGRHNDNHAAMN